MKDGLRFVDSDMHIMEPPDLFERYLDPRFKHRVTGPIDAHGRPRPGTSAQTIIGGLPGTQEADMQQLRKDGASAFRPPEGVTPVPIENPNVIQGAIEKSNVHSVIAMTRMIEVTRSYTEVATILQQQNEMRKNSLQQLAEVPA